MASSPIRVLLVEDDEDDFLIISDLLREVEVADFLLTWIPDYQQGMEALDEGGHHVCLVDYRLGAYSGIDFVKQALARGCDIPLIVLTGQGDHEVDVAATEAGASDFLNKSQITSQLLERSIRYSIQQKRTQRQQIALLNEQLARKQAEEANRAKDEFLAMLAHELRNPLAAIVTSLELLRRQDGGEIQQSAADIADRQIRLLVRLIDDLLDVSRITQGKIQLCTEPLRVADVVQRAVDAIHPQIERSRQTLAVHVETEDLWVEADPARLEQVIANLLTNAIKYTDPEGKIWLSAERQGEFVAIRCRDTGIGMTPEMLNRVFDLFTQVNDSLARSRGGLGIGLTLVRRLVEMHGGEVVARSQGPGRGSEFTVRLRAIPAPAQVGPGGGESAHEGSTGRRVLIVDDNVDASNMLGTLLRLNGHQVEVAHSGSAALQAARSFRPDIVLLDIGLPGMDGFQVAQRLRADPECQDIVLIAMTGYSQPTFSAQSKAAGFDHYLVKPVDHQRLNQVFSEVAVVSAGARAT